MFPWDPYACVQWEANPKQSNLPVKMIKRLNSSICPLFYQVLVKQSAPRLAGLILISVVSALCLPDNFLGGGVKDVDRVHVKRHRGLLTQAQFRAWVDAGNERILSADEIEEDFVTH